MNSLICLNQPVCPVILFQGLKADLGEQVEIVVTIITIHIHVYVVELPLCVKDESIDSEPVFTVKSEAGFALNSRLDNSPASLPPLPVPVCSSNALFSPGSSGDSPSSAFGWNPCLPLKLAFKLYGEIPSATFSFLLSSVSFKINKINVKNNNRF